MSCTRSTSTGTCALCHETLAKSAMSRHLAGCLAKHPARASVHGFHLVVEGAGAPQYWMHLAARADAELGDVDSFLRRAWLECCGHLSDFTIGELRGDDLGMETKLADVLRPRLAFAYEYDFGSTTKLTLRVVAELPYMPRGKAVQLLALNDAPSYPCEVCGEPAQVVDRDGDELLCKACAKDHADEDMVLPLVNSPRAGVCGYVGPPIHLQK